MKGFTRGEMFSYNEDKKRKFIFYSVLIGILLTAGIIYYILYLKNSNFFLIQGINSFFGHIANNIKSFNGLGAFYTTLFGGLFFVPTPIEVLFITTLRIGNLSPILLISLYMTGMIIAFTINYLVGMKLSNLSLRIIGAKKFYKIKGFLNKHGMWGIFLFNLLPLPSQPLSTILGVFRYNKSKFYLMFISGQLIKFILITLGYVYIL